VHFFTGTYYADQYGGWRSFADILAPQNFSGRILRCADIFASARVCRLPPLASIFWELRSSNSAMYMYYLRFSALGSLFVSSSSAHDFGITVSAAALWDI
jgi:hypothetical protein